MAFSMHSHSGQFCPGHAADSLEDVILTAIAKGMETFALTEHMPRNSDSDRYPEEVNPLSSVLRIHYQQAMLTLSPGIPRASPP
jgi:histidinol-phosphatase (PHP family)